MSVNDLSHTQLQCWESTTQHTANDGKPAAVFSAANSNTFLGRHRFLYSTSNAHATLPKGKKNPSRASKPFSAVRESQRDKDQLLICLYWSSEKNRAQVQVAGWQRVVQATGQPCAQYRRFLKHKRYNSERVPVIITEMRIPWLS